MVLAFNGDESLGVQSNKKFTKKTNPKIVVWLVVEFPTHLKKYDRQNGFIFPKFRGENKKIWETTT